MAHFQSTMPVHGQPTWTPTGGYAPVEQSKEKAHVSVNLMSTGRRLSRKESYRPFPHKTLPLLCLAIIALGLIGALEYTLRVLPQTSFDIPTPVGNATIGKRQETVADGSAPAAETSPAGGDAPAADGSTAGGQPTINVPPPPPSTQFLDTGATTVDLNQDPQTILPTTASTAYINAEGTTVITGPTPVAGAPGATGAANQSPVAGGVTGGVAGSWTGTTSLPNVAVGSGTVTGSAGSAAMPSGAVATDMPGGGKGKEPILHSQVPLTLVKNPANYFLSTYAGVLIAIVLRLLVGYLFRSTKLVDPFFMLSKAEGSPFPLWEDHLGCETVFAPWFAARNRRWLLLCTSVAYAASQLLSPFASELTSIHLSIYQLPNGYVRGQSVWVNPTIVRLLQTLLGIIFLLVVFTWIMLRRMQSSIRDNPASLAVIASLVGHPTTARDLKINQWADKSTTARLFENRIYHLGSYMIGDTECYGIVPANEIPPATISGEDLHAPISRSVGRKDSVNLLFMTASAAAIFGIILGYLKSPVGNSLDLFMNSQSFGPRFVLSALGLLLKSPLLALSARTAASVPFSRLAARPRRRADLITPVPITPQGAIGYTLKRRAWFAGSLAIVSGVIVEVLLILLPGVPFNAQLAYRAAEASWYGSLTCLGMILLVALIGWVRLFARPNEWPKSPTTVGAIAMYVAGTSMSADCAAEGGALPNRHLRYEFGVREGRWVVEYSSESFDGAGTSTGTSAKAQGAPYGEPTIPNIHAQFPHDTAYHSPTVPHPPAPTYRDEESAMRSGSFDSGTYPGRPQHFRAASLGGAPAAQPSPVPAPRDDVRSSVSSLSGSGHYPGRPQYGVETREASGRHESWS